MEIDSLKQV
jgi:Ran GTPase-activating protein (RanGAP) involved in mRNA processing and transport